MRFPGVSAILFACAVSAGCTSTSSGVDQLLAQPSLETTSSITPPVNVIPPAEIGSAASNEEPPQQMMAMAPSAPIPDALVPTVKAPDMRVPKAEPVAFVVPSKPSAKTFARGRIYSRRFRDAKPINFGRASPKALAVHGVDVSRWQGEIDWGKLRTQGANFVYIKATDGGDHLDPMFKKNWHRAHEAGLRRGAYHFFYWCRTAGEQADWFIRNVPKVKGALPPVIDVEWNGESRCKRRPSRKNVLKKMQVFMDKLERHYGQRPIIYTAPDFYRDNLRGKFRDYPFWLRAVAEHPSKVYPGRKWVFWQYSGSGLSHGVDGRIDLNAFHGSEDAWHRWVAARSR
ncbi:glycosyl hydrolase [Phyllobacterium phragmitis]|uniref:Glycosyl hydrolase n=1 Tax=Phyllobacterium phragmitis TaxID=2670329 RepID=A0A2S9IVR0_9HYPH|nr:GH25 family lysozyme [Phyllobacterium phragmitis]PRD44616.1 glycosyl hydrolase [Phyllobacterium phragmitis]